MPEDAEPLQPLIHKSTPLVSIGIPTFERPDGLKNTLIAMSKQTYQNLEIIVADNGSVNPRVDDIVYSMMRIDNRIKYLKSSSNRGASHNFLRVLEASSGQFFMWASDDDRWEVDFVSVLLDLLMRNENSTLAFCDIDVITESGSLDSSYGSFYETFKDYECNDVMERLCNYILQDPARGKANLIYGLIRKSKLDSNAPKRYLFSQAWGADILFVADLLSRGNFMLSDQLLHHKDRYWKHVEATASDPVRKNIRSCHMTIYRLRRILHYWQCLMIIGSIRTVALPNRLRAILHVCKSIFLNP
jgi:glycosyltransferase involved in cell wall biosynthesis